MNYSTGKCAHCGADSGLHHWETQQCPKNGVEAWPKPEVWITTTFEDSGEKKLRDAAPALLETLQKIYNYYKNHPKRAEAIELFNQAESAIKKATI